MSKLTKAVGAAKLLLKAKAPTLMVVGGVAAMGTGTVVACKQTLKIEEVMSEFTPYLEKIQNGERLQLEGYTANDARADRIKVYARTAVALGRLYAIPGVLLIGGAGLVCAGHRILVQRNATLALAFTGLKKSFDAYRGRVVDNMGEDADRTFMGGGTLPTINAKGKVTDPGSFDLDEASLDPYNRVFEQGASDSWQNDLGVNKMFIHQQQRFAQERLNRRGYLYLSEVYEALGFPESDISRVVGWKVTRDPKDGSKNFPVVDFGLDKPYFDDYKWNNMNAIYLDFNCMGLIVGGKLQKILEKA